MPRVYVIDALKPRGGTYMAYHVGLVLQQQFGYELMAVQTEESPLAPQFDYEIMPPTVALAQLEATITDNDLLVVNPSYSYRMLGLKLRGRKICYVQNFRTFSILDGYFDFYVSVSQPVQVFLEHVYGLHTPVIPPFIALKKLPQAMPWRDRPTDSAMMYIKAGEENNYVGQELKKQLSAKLPQLIFKQFSNNGVQHAEFLQHIASVRYLVNVSMAEGFGLIPLEAMALGTCVAGFDGVGGRDFLRYGVNSMTRHFNELQQIVPTLQYLLENEDAAEAMAIQGMQDARQYSLKIFRQTWQKALAGFLGR